MLDIKAVRQNPESVALALEKRGFTFDIEQFKALDARRKQADVDSQNLLAERKAAAGVNDLPADMLKEFIDTFAAFYA